MGVYIFLHNPNENHQEILILNMVFLHDAFEFFVTIELTVLYVFLSQDMMLTIPIINTRLKIIIRFVILIFFLVV